MSFLNAQLWLTLYNEQICDAYAHYITSIYCEINWHQQCNLNLRPLGVSSALFAQQVRHVTSYQDWQNNLICNATLYVYMTSCKVTAPTCF